MTKLAEIRRSRGISQDRLAALIGISGTTYREMETGKNLNPPIGYLANCALVLGCELEDLIDERYRGWFKRHPDMPGPPENPQAYWNTSRGRD
jgi:transcriptional regulator with XRE-family HTH domain